MGINKISPVTDTVTGGAGVGGRLETLLASLEKLDRSVGYLKNASVFGKAEKAEVVLSDARSCMALTGVILSELNLKIEVINQQLARINGVMGFPHGK